MVRRILGLGIAFALAITLGSLVAPRAGAQGASVDCADFPSQAAAQAAYRSDPSDPAGNDADEDGVACELVDYDDPATDTDPVGEDETADAAAADADSGREREVRARRVAAVGGANAAAACPGRDGAAEA